MTTMLAPWHRQFTGRLAGSVYAAPPSRRTSAARALSAAGLAVHVDMMATPQGLNTGVGVGELRKIAGAVAPSALEVHLIGSAEFVEVTLPDVLPLRPGKVFLPWAAFTAGRACTVRAAGSSAWISVWNEWDGLSAPQWPAHPDGVLVMLIEPGTRERCRLERLSIAAACATRMPGMPVVVDGGITEEIAPLCLDAGVWSMVVGRALLPTPGHRKEA